MCFVYDPKNCANAAGLTKPRLTTINNVCDHCERIAFHQACEGSSSPVLTTQCNSLSNVPSSNLNSGSSLSPVSL